MLITQCNNEPTSSFNDETYDIPVNNSFQPLNNYENSFDLSCSVELQRLRSHVYGCEQKSVNPDLSFSPLRDFKHCNLERITSIRNLTPKNKYCRNKTLAHKNSHKFSENPNVNQSLVKCLSLVYNEQNHNAFGSALCEQDKQFLEGLESSVYENKKSNFRNLLQKSTE